MSVDETFIPEPGPYELDILARTHETLSRLHFPGVAIYAQVEMVGPGSQLRITCDGRIGLYARVTIPGFEEFWMANSVQIPDIEDEDSANEFDVRLCEVLGHLPAVAGGYALSRECWVAMPEGVRYGVGLHGSNTFGWAVPVIPRLDLAIQDGHQEELDFDIDNVSLAI